MPVVTLWLFAAGGAAIAARAERPSRFAAPAIPVRLALAIPLVLLAALPYEVLSSQAWLDRANEAFAGGDCAAASDDARSSISALGSRPEPYELLGYCAIRDGRPRQAIDDMQEAIDRDPDNWNFHYGLALARGAAGLDPRPEALARRINPLEPLAKLAVERFATDRPGLWKRRGQGAGASLYDPLAGRLVAVVGLRGGGGRGGHGRGDGRGRDGVAVVGGLGLALPLPGGLTTALCLAVLGVGGASVAASRSGRERRTLARQGERSTEANRKRNGGERCGQRPASRRSRTACAFGGFRLCPRPHLEAVELLPTHLRTLRTQPVRDGAASRLGNFGSTTPKYE